MECLLLRLRPPRGWLHLRPPPRGWLPLPVSRREYP